MQLYAKPRAYRRAPRKEKPPQAFLADQGQPLAASPPYQASPHDLYECGVSPRRSLQSRQAIAILLSSSVPPRTVGVTYSKDGAFGSFPEPSMRHPQ